jgi:predicted small lipoprotein YifL
MKKVFKNTQVLILVLFVSGCGTMVPANKNSEIKNGPPV